MPMVPVNSVVGDFKDLNNIPIRSRGTQTIFIRDLGSVEDGAARGWSSHRIHAVTERADASTLAVHRRGKQAPSLFGRPSEHRGGRFPKQGLVFAGKPSELPEAVPCGDFCHGCRGSCTLSKTAPRKVHPAQ